MRGEIDTTQQVAAAAAYAAHANYFDRLTSISDISSSWRVVMMSKKKERRKEERRKVLRRSNLSFALLSIEKRKEN